MGIMKAEVPGNIIRVFLEVGKVRTFAGAIDWPGWCRNGREEQAALRALVDYGIRYAQVLEATGIEFSPPPDAALLQVIECLPGNASTDFGAPSAIPSSDSAPMNQDEFERSQILLQACWGAFDRAVRQATGLELIKGPRGGGRELHEIMRHVLEADRAYLKRLAWKSVPGDGGDLAGELIRIRQDILTALDIAVKQGLPTHGPRGGVIWSPRYFVRRVAWHVLDHSWEIEDRVIL